MAILVLTSLFYINEPVVVMREAPNHNSKVVSHAIFSERVEVEKQSQEWCYIKTSDNYAGWVHIKDLIGLEQPYETSLKVSSLTAHIYNVMDTEFGPIKTVPYGTRLKAIDETNSRWIKILMPNGVEGYIQKGDVASEPVLHKKEELVSFSQRFLNLPYTWGGRSSFGYDCSGFIQMLYSKIGIDLPRDSYQQAEDARFQTISLNELEAGDLIFFANSERKVKHLGMFLGQGLFIHATARENKPWLRISSFDDLEWSGSSEVAYPHRFGRKLIK